MIPITLGVTALKLITLRLLTTMYWGIVSRWLGILRVCRCRVGRGAVINSSDAHAIRASRILLTRRLGLGSIGLRSVGRIFGGVKAAWVNGRVDSWEVAVTTLASGGEVTLAELVEDDGGVDEHADEGGAVGVQKS